MIGLKSTWGRWVALELTRWGRRRAIGLESAWWRWKTSGCARIDTVEWQMSVRARKGTVGMVDEQLGSKGHGQGWETSVQAQIDMVELKGRKKLARAQPHL